MTTEMELIAAFSGIVVVLTFLYKLKGRFDTEVEVARQTEMECIGGSISLDDIIADAEYHRAICWYMYLARLIFMLWWSSVALAGLTPSVLAVELLTGSLSGIAKVLIPLSFLSSIMCCAAILSYLSKSENSR